MPTTRASLAREAVIHGGELSLDSASATRASNYRKFAAHVSIFGFSESLFGLFIPAYLLANGFSLSQYGLFFLLPEVVNAIVLFPILRRLTAANLKVLLALGVLASAALMPVLYFIRPEIPFIFLLSILSFCNTAFYWSFYAIIFTYVLHRDTVKDLSRFMVLISIVNLILIPVSGYILEYSNKLWLMVGAVGVSLVSLLPLASLRLGELQEKSSMRVKEVFSSAESRSIYFSGMLEEAATHIAETILPIINFILYRNYVSAAFVLVLAAVGPSLYAYVVGSHRNKTEGWELAVAMFNICGTIMGVALMALFYRQPIWFFIVPLALSFFREGYYVTMRGRTYRKAMEGNGYSKLTINRFGHLSNNMVMGILIIMVGSRSIAALLGILAVYLLVVALGFRKNVLASWRANLSPVE